MATMRALRAHSRGGPEVLVYELAPRPCAVSGEVLVEVEAAALPLAALTAWQAFVDHASLVAGERVLVHGGAGGVGGYAIQLAASLGAEVTATSVGKVEYVKSLGAHRVVDVSSEDFDAGDPEFDIVIDTVGGQLVDRSYSFLRKGGGSSHFSPRLTGPGRKGAASMPCSSL